MQHQESSIKIYYSRDYSLFKMINGNRQLNQAKIKRIENDIAQGLDVLRYCPIMVRMENERLEIIDGQHRFWVAKQMRSKVWYVLVEDFGLQEIAKINSNTEKWKNEDYINCYDQLGNEHYQALRNFLDEHKLPFTISLRLLASGKIRESGLEGNVAHDFKNGKYVVSHKEQAETFVKSLRMFSDFDQWNNGHFIKAIFTIIESGRIGIADVHEKYLQSPERLVKCESTKAYLVLLEDIVNRYERTRKILY